MIDIRTCLSENKINKRVKRKVVGDGTECDFRPNHSHACIYSGRVLDEPKISNIIFSSVSSFPIFVRPFKYIYVHEVAYFAVHVLFNSKAGLRRIHFLISY
jgi:hypothetical protein